MAAQQPRRPTMNDVARDADVSLKTVSRVVNRMTTVDPVMSDRVLVSIRRLGYRRNDVAATLRTGTVTRTIGLITADLQNAFYTPIAAAIASAARARDFHLITASSEESPDLERTTALDLFQRRVSGLVMVPSGNNHRYLATEVKMGTPVVFVDRPGGGLRADAVLLDNAGGAAAAVDELLAAGHTRIAVLLDSLEIYTMRERHAGVVLALERAGLALDPRLVGHALHTPDDAAAAVASMLDLRHPPTAVLCGNNRSLIGAVDQVWRRRSDAAVVGFDDFETSRLLPMPVRIVNYDAAELGRIAAERIFARLDGDTSAPRTILLPTELVSRGGFAH